jgi:NAD(P)H-hydrate epimerase
MGLAIADEEGLKNLVKSLLDQDVRLSLDASALVGSILPVIYGKNVVLTPHAGEFQRLFGVLPSNKIKERITLVERFAKEHQTTILLKGATDVISNGNQTYINPKNLASMTVGGTGDVLSGLVAGLLSKNRNTIESAAAASYVNGVAGKLAQKKHGFHILATDLIDNISSAMKPFDKVIK